MGCFATFAIFEIDDFPRRWPRRQDDSLEAGEGVGAGLGPPSWAMSVASWSDGSKRERRGDGKRCLSGPGER